MGGWEKVHDKELHNLYFSPSVLRWKRNVYRILVGKPEGKTPLGRTRRRWVDNIKTDLREMGRDGMDWINLAHDRDQWRAQIRECMSKTNWTSDQPVSKPLPTQEGRNRINAEADALRGI
jgi:hypothetical protein